MQDTTTTPEPITPYPHITNASTTPIHTLTQSTTTPYTIYTPFQDYIHDTRGTITTYLTLNGTNVGTYTHTLASTTGTLTFTHTNYLGTPVLATNNDGDIIETFITDTLGNPYYKDSRADAAFHTKGYTGHTYDSESSLTYAHARYLDTTTHSFLSVDPLQYSLPQAALYDPQSLNGYAYARNNPVLFTDPDGKTFKEFAFGNQSWTSYELEIGQSSEQFAQESPVFNWATNHPYVAGAVTGVVAGTSIVGAAYVMTEAAIGYRLANLARLPIESRVDLVRDRGFEAIQKATGMSRESAIDFVQKAGKSLIDNRNRGNINSIANYAEKVVRITTTSDAAKIISAGVMSPSKVAGYISSGAMTSVSRITNAVKLLSKIISKLGK